MAKAIPIETVLNEIPAGDVLTGTVTFRNRGSDDYAAFVVTLDLPQGRIEVCSGISFPGAIKNFGDACAFWLPKMVRALPKNEIDVVGLGFFEGSGRSGNKLMHKKVKHLKG
jgi:hypothetical protein